MGMTLADEDESNQLLDVETQVAWLREIGFAQVDCFWKWRELAVFGGMRPAWPGAERGAACVAEDHRAQR